MSVLYVLLPLALLFAVGFVIVFVRAVRSGQFDDLATPPLRILDDDDDAPRPAAERPPPPPVDPDGDSTEPRPSV